MGNLRESGFQSRLRFIDNNGKIWYSDDLNKLDLWEIEDLGLHVAEI